MKLPHENVVSASQVISERSTKQRPPLLRALGRRDPPETIDVAGETFHHVRTFKHDSWAATALYQRDKRLIVCKFNREQSVFGLPARWVGWLLARRERNLLIELNEVPNVPNHSGIVTVAGRVLPTAVTHEYIAGQPLSWHTRVNDAFFPKLRETVLALHQRNIAYVDLHKLENVIVDEHGAPHLIDFQICMKSRRIWPLSVVLDILQKSDLYHLDKHELRIGPKRADADTSRSIENLRPWWIRLHRFVAVPVRTARRRLLVAIGVRRPGGRASSEQFVEEGLSRKPCLELEVDTRDQAA